MSFPMHAKESIAMHFQFDEFGHILSDVKKPILTMTDNKFLKWLLQNIQFPQKSGNLCYQAPQFIFVLEQYVFKNQQVTISVV